MNRTALLRLLLLPLFFLFVSCSQHYSFDVMIYANGGTFTDGSIVKTIKVDYGATIAEPETPKYSLHTFDGWYTDQSLTTKFDFTTRIDGPISLYAKWIQDVDVIFYINFPDGTDVTISSFDPTVEEAIGKTVPDPDVTMSFTYNGATKSVKPIWRLGSAEGDIYDFTKPVTEDIKLYADWSNLKESNVHFVYDKDTLMVWHDEVTKRGGNVNLDCFLLNDITLDDSYPQNWESVYMYGGTFDGNGHVIYNMKPYFLNYEIGMFATVHSGTVKNLGLRNMTASPGGNTGCIASQLLSGGTISQCYVYSNISSIDEFGGGIVGEIHTGGTVKNCCFIGQISGDARNVGGIAGESGGTITNCFAKYQYSTVEGTYRGVLCGNLRDYEGETGPLPTNSYWTGGNVAIGSNTTALQDYKITDIEASKDTIINALNTNADTFHFVYVADDECFVKLERMKNQE